MFETLARHSPDGIVVLDDAGVVRYANPAAESLLAAAEPLAGGPVPWSLDPSSPDPSHVTVGDPPRTIEIQHARFTYRAHELVIATLRDVTEAQRREATSRHDADQMRRLFENSIDAMIIADARGRYLDCNPAAVEMLGYPREQLLAMSAADLITPEGHQTAGEQYDAFTQAGKQRGTFTFVDPQGRTRHLAYTAFQLSPDRFVSSLRDETDRIRLAEQLGQSQRMEAVGRLAGGIAHDFNNLLMTIVTYAGFLRQEMPIGDPRIDDIDALLQAADRGAGLAEQLLSFSRRQLIAPSACDLNQLVRDALRFLHRSLGEDIDVVTRLHPDPWPVFIDTGQFEMVILNLAVNARDAMPHGGRLTIETDCISDASGDFVVLRLHDTGHGFDHQIKQHMFEPFFTTKDAAKGTGLGLATVYGAVVQAEGSITAEGRPGHGATFEIRLPRVAAPPQEAKPARKQSQLLGGGETILVVEDDDMVRRGVARMLTNFGYRVVQASSGVEAIERARRESGDLHLAVCDVIMPQLSGPDTVAGLRQEYPAIRALYMTGYVDAETLPKGIVPTGVELLTKPFTERQLIRAVRRLLDEPE